MLLTLSAPQLRQAATIKDRIDSLQLELDRLMGSAAPHASRHKRKMGAAVRAKIAAAQKARWHKVKTNRTGLTIKTRSRKMSRAARAKIAAAAKARWARARAAGRNSL